MPSVNDDLVDYFGPDALYFSQPLKTFADIDSEAAIRVVEHWFVENFEDESIRQQKSYWRPPYSPQEVITQIFGEAAPPEVIHTASSRLQRISSNWLPKDFRIRYATQSTDIETLHTEMLRQIASLEHMLPLVEQPPGLGHNNPPEAIEPYPFEPADLYELDEAVEILKSQNSNSPAIADARSATEVVQAKREKLLSWLARQGDAFVSEAVKEGGKEFGKWAPRAFWLLLADRLLGVSEAVIAWLRAISS